MCACALRKWLVAPSTPQLFPGLQPLFIEPFPTLRGLRLALGSMRPPIEF
jgi:hypothetical protein